MHAPPNLFHAILSMALVLQQLLLPTAWTAPMIGNSGSAITICSTSGAIPQQLIATGEQLLQELEGTVEQSSAPHCSLCAHLYGSPLPDEVQLVRILFPTSHHPIAVAKNEPALFVPGPPLGLRAPPIA